MPKVNATYYEERKNYIIECAYRVLERKPLNEIQMRDIIKETGFSQGTIYNYYENVDKIISVLISQYMSIMRERLSCCIEQFMDFKDCYQEICSCLIGLYEENSSLFEGMLGRLSYHSVSQGPDDDLFQVYQEGEALNDRIIKLLERGMQEGIVRTDLNLHVTVFYLWSGIGQVIIFSYNKQQYLEEELGISRQEYLKQGFDLVIRSILK